MSIETSIQLLSFDRAGYPLAVGFNVLHLLTRLPVFVSALPTWMQFGSSRSRYLAAAQDLADADRRLEALRREARGPALSWGWLVSTKISRYTAVLIHRPFRPRRYLCYWFSSRLGMPCTCSRGGGSTHSS